MSVNPSTLSSLFSRLELAIAWRYFRERKQTAGHGQEKSNRFVSFISLVSLLGIALGIAALIVVTSVMNGFANETRQRLLSASTHVKILPVHKSVEVQPDLDLSTILNAEGITDYGVAPYLSGVGMLAHGNKLAAVQLHGIDPRKEDAVTGLSSRLSVGDSMSLSPDVDNILIGSSMAYQLGVSFDDEITLILPRSNPDETDFTPKLKRFRVAGIFHFPFPEPNQREAFMHIENLAALADKPGDKHGFRMRLPDAFSAPDIRNSMLEHLNPGAYEVTDWTIEQASFFRAIRTERTIMFILLFLIVAVAVFNIVSTLMMVVKNKRQDIAILRTLGLSPASVTQIFFLQGMFISLIGIVLGLLLGLLITRHINSILPVIETLFGFSLFPRDMFLISGLPTDVNWTQLLLVVVIAFVLSTLAAIYPARKAAFIEPGEALRYD